MMTITSSYNCNHNYSYSLENENDDDIIDCSDEDYNKNINKK